VGGVVCGWPMRDASLISGSDFLLRAKDWTAAERLAVAAELESSAAALRGSVEVMELSAVADEHPKATPTFYLQQRKQ
jgi:hypothetical protein